MYGGAEVMSTASPKLRRRVASPYAASETTGELSVDMECSPMRYSPMRSPIGRYETPQMTQISTVPRSLDAVHFPTTAAMKQSEWDEWRRRMRESRQREPKPTTPAKRVKPGARASPPAVGAVAHARSISQFTRSSALPVELAHDGSDFATAKKPSRRLILLDEGGRPRNISGLTGTQWAPTSRHGRV